MRRKARGQTLVIFAMTMLAMVVMVCITLAIGMKAREKMELQTIADAAAYSNAVAAARTYNAVSVLTRAQISHMVVLAGAQSHISYSGWYFGALHQLRNSISDAMGSLCVAPEGCLIASCAQATGVLAEVEAEIARVQVAMTALDPAAATEARTQQGIASSYGVYQTDMYEQHFLTTIGNSTLTQRIIDLAVPDPARRAEYVINPGGVAVSMREVGGPTWDEQAQGATASGAYNSNSSPDLALLATHGTRASEFTRNRGRAPGAPGSIGALIQPPSGSGYFSDGPGQLDPNPNPYAASANDVGSVGGVIGCLPVGPAGVSAHVKSTDTTDGAPAGVDAHNMGPAPHTHPDIIHTMGSCRECPSVWVARVEFNQRGPEDQWGQPKQYVALDRDYTRRTGPQDPWNLFFNFRFTNTGNGQTIDLGKTQGGAEFTHQTALATAITYYHRHDGASGEYWREMPNFFNPFWRATLVPADIDDQGVTDMDVAATPLGPNGAAAMNALRNAGFRGWQ